MIPDAFESADFIFNFKFDLEEYNLRSTNISGIPLISQIGLVSL